MIGMILNPSMAFLSPKNVGFNIVVPKCAKTPCIYIKTCPDILNAVWNGQNCFGQTTR